MRAVIGGVAVTLLLAGCGAGNATPPVASSASPAPSVSVVRVVRDFELYTHCGVREARVGERYYEATPVLDDGAGNPPRGWERAVGTMTVLSDGTAHFSAPGGLEADFRERPNATAFAMICS